MNSVSGFFDPRGLRRAMGVPPRFQFHGADGSYSYAVGERDAITGKFIARHTPIPFGTKLVIDFGHAQRGWLSYKPYDDSHLVWLHEPVDISASPGESYTLVVRVQVYLPPHGLCQWTLGGTISQNQLLNVFAAFQHAAEAAAGKIPVAVLHPSRQIPIASRNNELHMSPELELLGWVVRGVDRYGPRPVPPPIARLDGDGGGGGGGLPPRLPLASPPSPAPTTTPPTPAPTPANEPPANDDTFAGMTPAKERPPF
jgi:hypothetical protein